MVGYGDNENVYNLFYPSFHITFIERSVQFEEEPMQEIELVKRDCSHPPLNDDVSHDYLSDFSDFVMEYEYYDMNPYHDSPIIPK